MKQSLTVVLEKPARKLGGDRYKEEVGYYTTYVPQSISRAENKIPFKKLKITFEDVE
jgi:hypothetical protein